MCNRSETPRRLLRGALLALLACTALPASAGAQDAQRTLRDSQLRLDSIREERSRLQREMDELQSRVRDAARELQNVGRQRAASLSALQELEFQTEVLSEEVEAATHALTSTRARLRTRTNEMHQRLRSIYKRGRMHSLRVLLGAESFGDLLSRYKYLHMMTVHERMMLEEVRRLEQRHAEQEAALRVSLVQLDGLRRQKEVEVAALERLESQNNRALQEYRQQENRAVASLDRLDRDEAVLASVIRDLERRRLGGGGAEAFGRPAPGTAITTRSLGSLAWPVDGEILYRFGLERRPNNVVLRQNGIGIGAPAGTAVRAVEHGVVSMARALEGYGPAVMLSHGGGYYTLYLHLRNLAVREGQEVGAGQTLGSVGGEQTPLGPHIEFRVLVPLQGGPPQPVDPLDWLRAHASRGG